jgi:FtsP/CotA-like multicopper oxidase with cupredoxin domain
MTEATPVLTEIEQAERRKRMRSLATPAGTPLLLAGLVLATGLAAGAESVPAHRFPSTTRPSIASKSTQRPLPQPNIVEPQCYADLDGIDTDGDGDPNDDVVCRHLAAGDGFLKMADGSDIYSFGFMEVTGVPAEDVMMTSMLGAEFSAPTMVFREGQRVYLSLTNVGMAMRPDLFDPHSVHFHGFPQAAPVYDGEPMASQVIAMGNTFVYYYDLVHPGTFMYHCHVEASEHMQMGMLGQLYVEPKQNMLPDGTPLGTFTHHSGYKYVYNDGDGSTFYDVEFPIQMTSFDPNFHAADLNIQPPPFAVMKDVYPMLNGRGYPDTCNPANLMNNRSAFRGDMPDKEAQKTNAIVTAARGQKILLRISSLATTDFYTLGCLGIPMRIVGRGADILRGPDGKNLSYETTSVELGGGEAVDAILDTTDIAPGTYYLYTTNLAHLANNAEDYGGMMTEIVVTP